MCPGRGRMARYGAADCSGGHEARLRGPASEAAATISTSQQEAAHQAPCPRTANLDPISLITSAANCAHLSPVSEASVQPRLRLDSRHMSVSRLWDNVAMQ